MDRNWACVLVFATLSTNSTVSPCTTQEVPRADTASSARALIDSLEHVYSGMNLEAYHTLFTDPATHGIDLRFIPYGLDCTEQQEWGFAEEMRIHRRMFRPETITADEKPLPKKLWVKSIATELDLLRDFTERWDLYRSEQNPLGELDRHRWRAMDAVYATSVVWHLQEGGTLAIAGQARFVVVEDLTRNGNDPGRFLIYYWEDLGPNGERLTQLCSP